MIIENYRGYDLPKKEIDISDPYQENVLYDIVTAVRALVAPTYRNIEDHLNRKYSTEMVVNFLRWAEKNGYIHGHGGFYSKCGGGAKIWDFIKLPKYPYRWLEKAEQVARAIPDNWRRVLFKQYGYNLLVHNNRVVAISKNDDTINTLYRDAFDRYVRYVLQDDVIPEISLDGARYAIHTSDGDYKQPQPRGMNKNGVLIWDGLPFTFATCRRCAHNKGVLYQFIGGGWRPHILNTILCECRPHPFNRTWRWYVANWCKEYEQVV